MKTATTFLMSALAMLTAHGQPPVSIPDKAHLVELYQALHASPELSLHEEKTSARVAEEMRKLGFEVTEKVGGWGVVAVLKNGPGKTVMVRTDLDALPVREISSLPYASKVKTKDDAGNEVSVMHACGHDMHMTCWVGAASALVASKDQWHGTVVFIAQPAEERSLGAEAMLKDGLFTRFPKPEVCLGLHCSSELPAGTLGITSGAATASVDSVDITVHGIGGHGSQPQATKDPIVLAAQLVIALQTIHSRELHPLDPAVITVGSIHGGTKHNIIPDEAKLQITVRATTMKSRQTILDAIERIAKGLGIAAGLPESLLPEVKVNPVFTPVLENDPALSDKLADVFKTGFGTSHFVKTNPSMVGEDFARYGRTDDHLPICMFWLGTASREKIAEAAKTGQPMPSLHSPFFHPEVEPSITTGVSAMTLAVQSCLK